MRRRIPCGLSIRGRALPGTAWYVSLPFDEQIRFFGGKVNVPTERWADLWRDAHDTGFMVAGAQQTSLLDDQRGAVGAAVVKGETLAQFRKRFGAIVEKHGWSYKGSFEWRSRAIYETNLRTSHAAGRYRQMREIASRRPWWRYRHSDSVTHPRPHPRIAHTDTMARHVITIPYGHRTPGLPPGESGDIIWDDEFGTVTGDHYKAGSINRLLRESGIPTDLSGDGRVLVLNDPLHDPRDFWHLLPHECWVEPLRSTMPAILLDVEPTPAQAAPPPFYIIEDDGTRRPAVEGADFLW